MPNPQIDQFIHALFWKAAPWIVLCSVIGTFGGLFVKWLERRAIGFGRGRRERQADKTSARYHGPTDLGDSFRCPSCNEVMVKRTAKRGARAGSQFWGCPSYPACRGTREA